MDKAQWGMLVIVAMCLWLIASNRRIQESHDTLLLAIERVFWQQFDIGTFMEGLNRALMEESAKAREAYPNIPEPEDIFAKAIGLTLPSYYSEVIARSGLRPDLVSYGRIYAILYDDLYPDWEYRYDLVLA